MGRVLKKSDGIGPISCMERDAGCVEKAGLPHIKAHGFRHSCVSWLLPKGMSFRTVARWVGDTESVFLKTYSHLVPDEKDQITNFLDETFDN